MDFQEPARDTTRAKNWFFTINNPDVEADKEILFNATDLDYCLFQLESGEKTGTPHLQGCIGFKERKRFRFLKNLHPRANWSKTRKLGAALNYCSKSKTRVDGPWQMGEVPYSGKQGKRSDLDDVVKHIRKGRSVREIFEECPNAVVRYHNNISKLVVMFTPPRDFASRVFLFYGATGTGKTTAAMKHFKNPFKIICPKHGNLWFDGYDPMFHETVVIDDFYGGIKWGELLQLTDRHQFLVQIKGASVQFRAKTIIFTSNQHYESWYPKMDKAPFKRRLQEFGGVILFQNDGEKTLELGSFPDELRTPSPDASQVDPSEEEQPHDSGNHQESALNSPSLSSE